jgi:MerR family mercuric resistance operon transcriptional regulator
VVARLKFIRRTKELGFTLAEIKELLGLWFDANTRCEHIRHRAEQKITDIEDKIRSLQKMKRSLKKVIGECQAKDSVGDCPLLEGIDKGGRPNASKP